MAPLNNVQAQQLADSEQSKLKPSTFVNKCTSCKDYAHRIPAWITTYVCVGYAIHPRPCPHAQANQQHCITSPPLEPFARFKNSEAHQAGEKVHPPSPPKQSGFDYQDTPKRVPPTYRSSQLWAMEMPATPGQEALGYPFCSGYPTLWL